ncbi:uncharacterized protein V1510DRAFT_421746 [Dipodascopsis tothii]|uniref:uncharacterized protein n=1 Tax=Dipodascopsis tothii TaxID=44089 RepID=UPI0034CE70CC
MDYRTLTTWVVFFLICFVTALYATRSRWEPYVLEHYPLYERMIAAMHLRGRTGAGYFPGSLGNRATDANGTYPLPQLAAHGVVGVGVSGSSSAGTYATASDGSFQHDLESGLSSDTFSLHGNLAGDARKGLQEDSKLEIQNIMREHHMGFDEARRLYVSRAMERNAIGPDGRPRDPKAVFFS